MAITLNTLSAIDITGSGSSGSGTFTLAAGVEYLQLCIGCVKSSGTTSFTVTAVTITDASANTLTLTSGVIQRDESINGVQYNIAICGAKPTDASPSALVSGTCTVSITYNAAVNTAGPDLWVFQLDMGTSASTPYKGMAGTGIYSDTGSDPFTAFSDLALENGGFAIAFAMRSNTATMTVAGSSTGGAWTQQDDTSFSGARASVQYKAVSADYTETALALNPSVAVRHLGFFFWLKEVNDPSLTDVDTLPATPSATMTLTGTALDVANSGVRIRMIGTPTAYDSLTGYSASSSTAATAAMPSMLTEVPFTVGTSQTVEFVSTLSGAVSGVPFTGSLGPASGYAVVELVTPNTTASESVAANFGVTPAAIDQLYYQTDSGNVVIADSGVPTAGPSYVAGTALNAYLWDASASSGRWLGPIQFQLTDTGTVSAINTAGKVGRSLLDRMRRRRN